MPHIAISVDMLDTGIDVPEVVNLVFFKLVRSKTKFWQMVGRGTRLRLDLFGPGQNKEFFYIFDYCRNLEFFQQNPETAEGSIGMSLGKRLFTLRVELITELDRVMPDSPLRADTAELLRGEVAAMNPNNFLVRPKRKLVERYSEPEAWRTLELEQQTELMDELAGLPSERLDSDTDAKQFDVLMLQLQLAVLRAEPSFPRLRKQVEEIAASLSEKANIPMVRAQLPLIEELQNDEFWGDVTPAALENVRQQLRSLVKLIEKTRRKPVYTDFKDEIGIAQNVDLMVFTAGVNFSKFRAKARHFLKEHENHPLIRKLRSAESLLPADLEQIEQMLVQAGVGTNEDVQHAKQASAGLGLFLRGLAGLDRNAAKNAFARFLSGKTPTANQLEFLNLVIDHLTEHGLMDPALLYGSPFTDFNPMGVDGLFAPNQVDDLLNILQSIRQTAAV